MTAIDVPATTETEAAADEPSSGLAPLPWREIIRWALLGLVGVLAFVAMDVSRNGGGNPVSLVQPGQKGPAIEVFRQDFPDVEPPNDTGLDGQMYYAMARNPLHPSEVAPHLDRPRYRFQRPLVPFLAWAIHPTGGGTGLVGSLFLVGALLVFAGAVAVGVLGVSFGGKPWLAALLPLLPGTYWSLRVTVADAPALALVAVALALSVRGKRGWAVAVAVLAVLAKEPTILVFVGWAIWRRDREGLAMVAVPGLIAAAWMAWLHTALPAGITGPSEISVIPFGGLVKATSTLWLEGREWVGMVSSVAALIAGVAALVKRRGHPLWWVVAVLVTFAGIMSSNVIGMNFGGTRSNQALLLFAIVALCTPAAVGHRPSTLPLEPQPEPVPAPT